MSTAAVVNVRMESVRLPGKALRIVHGEPLLHYLLERLALARNLDHIIVATSVRAANDAIAAFCDQRGVRCFRGPEDDVLARTVGALQAVAADTGVVVYGDGPLVDPAIVDAMVDGYAASSSYDFVGNDLTTTYPPGMEVEVFSAAAMADASRRCDDRAIREHGTLFLRRNPNLYRLLNVEAPLELRRPELEIEVDTEADLKVVAWILAHFPGRMDFTLAEVIELLDAHPEIAGFNRAVPRRWKEFRSG
jgi:spore coat polysaccharide biosynthesis protein SpsF (cytidylyltransferase family)